jgi:hypothetical protein
VVRLTEASAAAQGVYDNIDALNRGKKIHTTSLIPRSGGLIRGQRSGLLSWHRGEMPYRPSDPRWFSSRAWRGSLALQYKQVKNQEEQQKRDNEFKQLSVMVELYKSTKNPVIRKQMLPGLNKAMRNFGFPEEVTIAETESPQAKNFLGMMSDGFKLYDKKQLTAQQLEEIIQGMSLNYMRKT